MQRHLKNLEKSEPIQLGGNVELEIHEHLPKVARVSTTRAFTEYTVPTTSTFGGITAGADGNVWFTENAASKVASITPLAASPSTRPQRPTRCRGALMLGQTRASGSRRDRQQDRPTGLRGAGGRRREYAGEPGQRQSRRGAVQLRARRESATGGHGDGDLLAQLHGVPRRVFWTPSTRNRLGERWSNLSDWKNRSTTSSV